MLGDIGYESGIRIWRTTTDFYDVEDMSSGVLGSAAEVGLVLIGSRPTSQHLRRSLSV